MSIQDLRQAVLAGDEDGAARLAQAELEAGTSPSEIMNDGLIAAMDEAGAKMATGELFIPEVLVAADAMKAAMDDRLAPARRRRRRRARHRRDRRRRRRHPRDRQGPVALMLDGAGFTVIDLGVDVKSAAFVAAAEEHHADVVAMSSLMVTTMPKMKFVVEALHEASCAAKPIVGGAPLSQAYADEIGAAGYAPDAGPAAGAAPRGLKARTGLGSGGRSPAC